MRIVLIAIVLVLLLAAGWVVRGVVADREDQQFAVHYSWIVKWALTLARDSNQAPTGASFASPRIEEAGSPNRWIVSGHVSWRDVNGQSVDQPYAAVVENLCKAYADRNCWRLAGFALNEAAVELADRTLAEARAGQEKTDAASDAGRQVAEALPDDRGPATAPAGTQPAKPSSEPDPVLALLSEPASHAQDSGLPAVPAVPDRLTAPLPDRKPVVAQLSKPMLPPAPPAPGTAPASEPEPGHLESAANSAVGTQAQLSGSGNSERPISTNASQQAVPPVSQDKPAMASAMPAPAAAAAPSQPRGAPAPATKTAFVQSTAPTLTAAASPPQSGSTAPAASSPPAAGKTAMGAMNVGESAASAPPAPANQSTAVSAAGKSPPVVIDEQIGGAIPSIPVKNLPPQAPEPATPSPVAAAPAAPAPVETVAPAQPLPPLKPPVSSTTVAGLEPETSSAPSAASAPVQNAPPPPSMAAMEPSPIPKLQAAALPPSPPLPAKPPSVRLAPPPLPPASAKTAASNEAGHPTSSVPSPESEPERSDPALIALIQDRLAKAGYKPGPPDGRFGARTQQALAAFERDIGLTLRAHPTRETLALLEQHLAAKPVTKAPVGPAQVATLPTSGAANAAPAPVLPPAPSAALSPPSAQPLSSATGQPIILTQPAAPVSVSSTGTDESLIFLIQHRLREAGYTPGRFDGRMSEQTAAAIRAYQAARSLPVNGVPSRALLERLEAEVLKNRKPEDFGPTPLGALDHCPADTTLSCMPAG